FGVLAGSRHIIRRLADGEKRPGTVSVVRVAGKPAPGAESVLARQVFEEGVPVLRGQGNEVVVVLLRRPADDVQSVLKDGGGREERQFARQGGLEFAVAQVLSPDFRAPAGKLRA